MWHHEASLHLRASGYSRGQIVCGVELWRRLVPQHMWHAHNFYVAIPGGQLCLTADKRLLPWEWFSREQPGTLPGHQRFENPMEDWSRHWPGGWVDSWVPRTYTGQTDPQRNRILRQQAWTVQRIGIYDEARYAVLSTWENLMSPYGWGLMAARLATLCDYTDLRNWTEQGNALEIYPGHALWPQVQITPIGRTEDEAIYFLHALGSARKHAGQWRRVPRNGGDYEWAFENDDRTRQPIRGLYPGTLV